MSLSEYHSKRTFGSTPEPAGGTSQGSGPLRFVVQKHAASQLHYDFRLEAEGVLKSWAVPKGPSTNPSDKHLAMMVEDHPFEYRTFEGIIPAGNYGAGAVMVWDEGTYEPLHASGNHEHDNKLVLEAIQRGHLTFILQGSKLKGEWALVKMAHAEDEDAWLLVKAHKDQYASEADITKLDRSAITGRSLNEIEHHTPISTLLYNLSDAPKRPLPTVTKPMLSELGTEPFDDPGWSYEIKWDGYRILSLTGDGKVHLSSRNGQDYTDAFHSIAAELEQLHMAAIIDGEAVVVDEGGKPSFQMLQNYLRTGLGHLMYYAFDIIHLGGHDLTSLPLWQRQEILRRVLPQGTHLGLSEPVIGQGKALFKQAGQIGLEGIMAKSKNSTYRTGARSGDWLKFKAIHRQETVVVGWTEPQGGRQYFGALVLGVYQDGQLVFVGHTGTGFSEQTLREVYERLKPLETDHSAIRPEPKTNEPAHWVKPKIVAEIEFTEWTTDGSMRHPVFIGLRDDKEPQDVVREEPKQKKVETSSPHKSSTGHDQKSREEKGKRPVSQDIRGSQPPREYQTLKLNNHSVHFTHPDKIFWPDDGITKGELLEYYLAIAPTILPYLRDRPESLNRFPHGITEPSFYQKNMDGKAPSWAKTHVFHSESENEDVEYLICQDEATLAYMLNLGCIDINPWNSRLAHLDRPDWAVIDLDPEAIDFEAVIETAQTVHAVLDELKVPSYPKTSGATGIHICVPLGAKYSHDQSKLFAELVANFAHQRLPKLTSVERLPKKRQGKVYLDFLQNRRGQTLASAYSVRPRTHATVSTPLHWDEVKTGLSPEQFTVKNIQARLTSVGDLWKPVLSTGIDLEQTLATIES